MILHENRAVTYFEDPLLHLNFGRFTEKAKDCVLFVGGYDPNFEVVRLPSPYPKYFLSTEEQWSDRDTTDLMIPYMDKIFTISHPKYTGRAKREFIFFPVNETYLPGINVQNLKVHDIIYTGHVFGFIEPLLNTVIEFKRKIISHDPSVTYLQKLEQIAMSKMSITHNVLDSGRPQLKTRCFEAAACKTLMLVLKDNYNVVEEFFKPGEDFLYFTHDNLKRIVQHYTDHYEEAAPFINSAYNKLVNNYTTEQFIKRYIGFK